MQKQIPFRRRLKLILKNSERDAWGSPGLRDRLAYAYLTLLGLHGDFSDVQQVLRYKFNAQAITRVARAAMKRDKQLPLLQAVNHARNGGDLREIDFI